MSTPSAADRPDTFRRCEGFTLLELAVVMLLLAIAASVAAPQFFPALRYASAEWEARQLAGFGTEAAAEAALFKDSVFVRIDLSAQEYYAVRLVYPDPDLDKLAEMYAPPEVLGGQQTGSKLFETGSRAASGSSMGLSRLTVEKAVQAAGGEESLDPEQTDLLMRWKVDQFVRRNLEAQARNVIHTEGLFEDSGSLFDKSFSFEESEPEEVELGGLLDRRTLPEGIRITSVSVNGEKFTRGLVEIEIPATGFSGPAEIELRSDEGEAFVITWNPLVNRGIFESVGEGGA